MADAGAGGGGSGPESLHRHASNPALRASSNPGGSEAVDVDLAGRGGGGGRPAKRNSLSAVFRHQGTSAKAAAVLAEGNLEASDEGSGSDMFGNLDVSAQKNAAAVAAAAAAAAAVATPHNTSTSNLSASAGGAGGGGGGGSGVGLASPRSARTLEKSNHTNANVSATSVFSSSNLMFWQERRASFAAKRSNSDSSNSTAAGAPSQPTPHAHAHGHAMPHTLQHQASQNSAGAAFGSRRTSPGTAPDQKHPAGGPPGGQAQPTQQQLRTGGAGAQAAARTNGPTSMLQSIIRPKKGGPNAVSILKSMRRGEGPTPVPNTPGVLPGSANPNVLNPTDNAHHPPIGLEEFVQNRDKALDALGSGQATEWEKTAAAAAVVAGGATATDSRQIRRYNIGDRVLVFQSSITGMVRTMDPSSSVVATSMSQLNTGNLDDSGNAQEEDDIKPVNNPVNKFGFPPGKGDTEEERRGPYSYVLATVKKVHFSEDARYYTVTREDTKTDQRADTEKMEPVLSARAEAAAYKAANTIVKREDHIRKNRHSGHESFKMRSTQSRYFRYCCLCALCLDALVNCMRSLVFYCSRQVTPRWNLFWRRTFRAVKRQANMVLNGLEPYQCKIKLTMVNVLVLCSIAFLFLDQIRLAFLPPSWDAAVVIASLIVWLILVLELIFETIIRPTGYNALIHSEKAYSPTTARYLNRFHLVMEIAALVLYIPELSCLFKGKSCGADIPLTLVFASIRSVLGPGRKEAFAGHVTFACARLRIFPVVRHWKQMWIHAALHKQKNETLCRGFLMPPKEDKEDAAYFYHQHMSEQGHHSAHHHQISSGASKKVTPDPDPSERDGNTHSNGENEGEEDRRAPKGPSYEEDLRLKNAATIGTALLVINSHRAMLLLIAIVGLLPIITSIRLNGGTNIVTSNMVKLLQANNAISPNPDDCEYLMSSIGAWLRAVAFVQREAPTGTTNTSLSLLWVRLLPARCGFEDTDGVLTQHFCDSFTEREAMKEICDVWGIGNSTSTEQVFADSLDLRVGAIVKRSAETVVDGTTFSVEAMFNEQHTVSYANFASFLLQGSLLLLILVGLSVLRVDAGRLVLNPLRRMLKIVLRYAENPLAPAPRRPGKGKGKSSDDGTEDEYSDSDSDNPGDKEDQLGHYETEQLINAVTKITDLLRKCWGVAGAGIISSNLARTEAGHTAVFNPCVPGRLVYALFGFVGINEFSSHLRALDQDVMILINDVARVVHGEVYRWGFGDTGQCNKNLGSTFLMVFRIGDSKEVQEKKNRATEVIFSSTQKKRLTSTTRRRLRQSKGLTTNNSQSKATLRQKKAFLRRRKIMSDLMSESSSLQLASLPGIAAFTDRAVIGMLKAFAGVYRDKNIQNWKDDFRLGAGVGAFTVDMIFGMDAGWAVEGAVGSEYKIDATYLSPHVNMAARMMSASKQYGVHLLVSQAVEELLSETARSKLRHIDTVTVKGSSLRQRIFTYDMRHQGVDFFLFDRSEKDADLDAECYSPSIWNTDQDLRAMRQHISEEFLAEFAFGRDQYLAGNWVVAVERLKKADDLMIKTVVDEGYIEEYIEDVTDGIISRLMDRNDLSNPEVCRLRNEIGDGPSRCLIAFMERQGCVAPNKWAGYRPLTSK